MLSSSATYQMKIVCASDGLFMKLMKPIASEASLLSPEAAAMLLARWRPLLLLLLCLGRGRVRSGTAAAADAQRHSTTAAQTHFCNETIS